MFFRRRSGLDAARLREAASGASTVPAAEPPETAKKVLVVDDDPVALGALSMKLKSGGYRVITAVDGSQALSATRRERPDAVLLDVNFPPDVAHGGGVPWNGFLLTEWLRRIEPSRNLPVILISGSERSDYPERATKVGAAGFLTKEAMAGALLESVGRLFEEPGAVAAGTDSFAV